MADLQFRIIQGVALRASGLLHCGSGLS